MDRPTTIARVAGWSGRVAAGLPLAQRRRMRTALVVNGLVLAVGGGTMFAIFPLGLGLVAEGFATLAAPPFWVLTALSAGLFGGGMFVYRVGCALPRE